MIVYTLGASSLYDQTEHKVTHKGVGGSVFTSFRALVQSFVYSQGCATLEDGSTSRVGIYVVSCEPEDLEATKEDGHHHLKQDAPIIARLDPAYALAFSDIWDDIRLHMAFYLILGDPNIISNDFLVYDYATQISTPLLDSAIPILID